MKGSRPGPLIGSPDRFWTHVNKSAGPDGCWNWTAATSAGRGRVYVAGRTVYAYRHAWFLTHGEEIPTGAAACHTCDNPICVNPSHIFLGAQRDNMLDAARKGRTIRPGYASDEVVRSARELYAAGMSPRQVASKIGRPLGTVEWWIAGKSRLRAGGPIGWTRAAA